MGLSAALASFSLVAALMVITPGLDVALILRTAIQHGRRVAAAAGLGITAGLLVWGVGAALGVSAVLTASPTAYLVVRLCGAAYMLYLGGTMLLAAVRAPTAQPDAAAPLGSTGPRAGFRTGLLTNLLNPKIGAFYLAVIPQFLPPGYQPALVGALLALIHGAETLIWFALLILAVHRMDRVLRRPGVQRVVDAGAGIVIIGFGLALGLSGARPDPA